jgi:glycerophosphoryl diester phosphodiesterase
MHVHMYTYIHMHVPFPRRWTQPDTGLSLAQLVRPPALRALARYAAGVGPSKASLVRWEGSREEGGAAATTGRLVSSGLVEALHGAGLQVHPYTFRPEAQFFVRPEVARSLAEELALFLGGVVRVDGLFTDYMPALDAWRAAGRTGGDSRAG